jgi:dihydrofolate synthase/folylpolyglutamate synthase
MVVNHSPRTVCDTGHNAGGVQYIVHQLAKEKYHKLHIVLGFVSDKDVTHILEMFPRYATYYFTNASIPRSMPAKDLYALASVHDLEGNYYPSVSEAYRAAQEAATADDMIFVGGSTFVVADFLTHLHSNK